MEIESGIDFTLDEKDYFIFTKEYLLKRGSCCELDCRNCPYKE